MAIEQTLDVFRDQVELQVDQISGASRVQIRFCSGVRNNPHGKTLLRNFRDRQANAVEGDRTFGGDITRKLIRQFDLDPVICTLFFQSQNGGGAIHVALHEMPPKASAGGEGTFQIDATVAAQGLQVCAAESFVEKIEGQLVAAPGRNSQAATVYRDAFAQFDFLGNPRRDDLKLRAPVGRLNP